jgi:hypothetical protein
MRAAATTLALLILATLITLSILEPNYDPGSFPSTPTNSGWLGIVSTALFVMGLAALLWSPREAVYPFGLSGFALLAAMRRESDFWLMAWALAILVVGGLASTATTFERIAQQRAAIHARIDEELSPEADTPAPSIEQGSTRPNQPAA